MEIIYPPTFITSLTNKHLLLDTNIFRDAAVNHSVFIEFFNQLKSNNTTIVTTDFVKYELLKGSANPSKYNDKEQLIHTIIDMTIPIQSTMITVAYNLIREYGIDGAALSVTDLVLGAVLMQYKQGIFLMTRDTTDFTQKVFDLKYIINAPFSKGIFTYGIYQYDK